MWSVQLQMKQLYYTLMIFTKERQKGSEGHKPGKNKVKLSFWSRQMNSWTHARYGDFKRPVRYKCNKYSNLKKGEAQEPSSYVSELLLRTDAV